LALEAGGDEGRVTRLHLRSLLAIRVLKPDPKFALHFGAHRGLDALASSLLAIR
jgi:hypothetical protein